VIDALGRRQETRIALWENGTASAFHTLVIKCLWSRHDLNVWNFMKEHLSFYKEHTVVRECAAMKQRSDNFRERNKEYCTEKRCQFKEALKT
jgi:hypothetical protein